MGGRHRLHYSNSAECSEINSIIVGLKLGYANANNIYGVSMYLFRKCPISYAMSTRARTGQSLVYVNVNC